MPTDSRVIVAQAPDWTRNYSKTNLADLVAMDEVELASIDPLAMNLIVAKGIPQLSHLELERYQKLVNEWTFDFKYKCLPKWESTFHGSPAEFNWDIDRFRLGMVCQYIDLELGIRYKEAHRHLRNIYYTNPTDLFLCGLLDTREGTCGRLSALHVSIGWRMKWPVSLAAVDSHYICRFDDGMRAINIETSNPGFGGWLSESNDWYVCRNGISSRAVTRGSTLRALSRRELLGAFVGLRARHLQDLGRSVGSDELALESERDWLLARYLNPTDRICYRNQVGISMIQSGRLFDSGEPGGTLSLIGRAKEVHANYS